MFIFWRNVFNDDILSINGHNCYGDQKTSKLDLNFSNDVYCINTKLKDPSKHKIVEEIVKPEPVETSYNVSYSTFTEVLKNSVSKELVNADAAYTTANETVSEESTIDSIYDIEFEYRIVYFRQISKKTKKLSQKNFL